MIAATRNWLAVGFVTFVALASSRTAVAAVSLADLVANNGSVIVGGTMVFDLFTYSATGSMPTADGVLIDVLNSQDGIRVQGGFVDYAGGGTSVLNVGYRVTTLDPGLVFSAATLMGNPTVIGTGNFTITETITGAPNPLTIFDAFPGSTQLLSSTNLPSTLSSLNVALSLVGNSTTGAVTASIVDQTFGVVPEPNSLVIWLGTLMVCGVVPLTYRRWTQSSRLQHHHA